MPKTKNWFAILYSILGLVEMFYVFLAWSPYGDPDGVFNSFYLLIRQNLNTFVVFGLIFLFFFSLFFPGIGYMALVITLYRVAELCCSKEEFGDGFQYGWGRYYPDDATFFNQGHIERDQSGTRAAYSSAVGDTKDAYRIAKLTEYENRISHISSSAMQRKVLELSKDGCGYGTWIVPNIKDMSVLGTKRHLCNGGCDICSVAKYGDLFEKINSPRPLYTTSTMSKELGSA